MPISKEILWIYISSAKTDKMEAFSALLVSENKRKQLFGRLQAGVQSAMRGIRLDALELGRIESRNEKTGLDFLQNLAGSNAADSYVLEYTPGPNAKQALLLQEFLLWFKGQIQGRDVRLVFDPDNIRASGMNTALKKASFPAEVWKEKWKESFGLQASLFLGELSLDESQEHANLKSRLDLQLSFGQKFFRKDGDALYIEKSVPSALRDIYRQLKDVPASIKDTWIKKSYRKNELEKIIQLLDAGMPVEDLAGISQNKLNKQFDQLLEQVQNQGKKEFIFDQTPALQELYRTYADKLYEKARDTDIYRIPDKNSFAKKLEDWFMQEDVPGNLRADIFLELDDDVIKAAACFEPDRLKDKDEDNNINPEFYALETFDAGSFSANLQALFNWLKSLGRKIFVHVPEGLAAAFRHEMLDENVLIYWSVDSVRLPEKPGTLNIENTGAVLQNFFDEQVHESLSEEQLQFLSNRGFGISVTRQLAKAFARGMSVEELNCFGFDQSPEQKARNIRERMMRYLYTSKDQRFLKEILASCSIAEYDYLANPALSLSKRKLLLEALEDGWSLADLKQTIVQHSSLSRMQRSLEGGKPEHKKTASVKETVLLPEELILVLTEKYGMEKAVQYDVGADRLLFLK